MLRHALFLGLFVYAHVHGHGIIPEPTSAPIEQGVNSVLLATHPDRRDTPPLRISAIYVDGNDVRGAVFVDSPSPTFNWELDCRLKDAPDDRAAIACPRGTVQTSHRLQIFSARTNTIVADTGVVDSPIPSLALRQGLSSLKATTKYTFELSVWTSPPHG